MQFFIYYKPILKRLQMKAQQAFRDANSGLPPKIPNDIFKLSNPLEETKDELSIFSGKTHTLTAKSTSSAVASAASTASTPSTSSNKSRSSSDSPQLGMSDNSSFKGVHPSLVSELNVFNGLIKRQLENAYKAGGEVFGGGEPMVVDGQDDCGGGGVQHHQQPTQMHVVRQHNQHQQLQQQHQHQHQQPQQVTYQPDYQHQHFDKQEAKWLEREREEAANREMERQEMEKHEVERQELARQQQLHQQHEIQRQQQHELLRQQQQAQQEIIQQQQQLDIRRQREKQQQQMQDQYRQQLEVPQHQLQQRQPPQYHLQRHSYDHGQPAMLTEPDHGMMTSSAHPAAPSPILTLSHSRSQPNIHHAYQQRPHHDYQQMHHPDTAGVSSYAPPPPPAQRVTQRAQQPIRYSTLAPQPQQQQHAMYPVPPEYSSSNSNQTGISRVLPPTSTYLPSTPISATSSTSSYVPHWSAGSYSFAMPDQQVTSASSTVSGAGSGSVYAWATVPRIQTPEYQQYTPEGALRGIAADDRSLQETWQSYMNKVSPHAVKFMG